MSATDRAAVFQVMIPGELHAADPLGLWQTAAVKTISGRQTPAGVLWHADLPVDPQDAAQALAGQSLLQLHTRQALLAVPHCLQVDLVGQPETGADLAYGVHAAELSGAQQVLLQARQYAQGETSFSVMDVLGVDDAVQSFEQFISQVRRMLGQFVLVESGSGGITLGLTQVAWTGGVYTYWRPEAGIQEATLHYRLLQNALATRQDWLRLLTLLTTVVLRISAALTLTPFIPLTIWTAWRYIQEILAEYHRLSNSRE